MLIVRLRQVHAAFSRLFEGEQRISRRRCNKIHIAFPPMATWMCYTDSVPHAVLSGQYALEQTFIIPVKALVRPEKSPIRVLEKMAGRPLAKEVAQPA